MTITTTMLRINPLLSFIIAFLTFILETYSVPVRLVGGDGAYEGRLEVYLNGGWGTVADDYNFGQREAETVCRQLGYTGYALATNSGVFGKGSGKIAFSQISCSTDEAFMRPSKLEQCELLESNSKSGHQNDVGVVCDFTSYPAFRLVGGNSPHEGRLEVFFRNKWGSVCFEDKHVEQNAKVLCRHLGYGGGSMTRASSAKFGYGSGPVWMKGLSCLSPDDPANIQDCVHQWGSVDDSSCSNRKNEAVLMCNTSIPAPEIRLVGGQSQHEGRLEIQYNGKWGTVCRGGGFWKSTDSTSAKMVCKQLGFSGDSFETSTMLFGQGSGWVWRSVNFCAGDVDYPCIDDAVGLMKPLRGSAGCDHDEDVGIICNVSSTPPVRLANSPNSYEGRPEIQFRGEWGIICQATWDTKQASTTCRQLGYSGYDAVKSYPLSHGLTWLSGVSCSDDAARVDQCSHDPIGVTTCSGSDTGGIICDASSPPVPIRLVGGKTSYEGRLEVKYDNEWGSVCVEDAQSWGQLEADVVCRQLGFQPGSFLKGKSYATSGNIFGPISHKSTIWLDRIKCDSPKNVLKDCERGQWGGRDACDHFNDVGVICRAGAGKYKPLPPIIRLTGGSGYHQGRLELFFNGEWGTVCHHKKWDYGELPKTVCRQLGLDNGKSSLTKKYGAGEGRIWLEGIKCNGDEEGIDSCQHAAWGAVTCDHSMDIGIQCDVFQGSSAGMVVGIIFALLIVILLVCIAFFFYKRVNSKPQHYNDVPMEEK